MRSTKTSADRSLKQAIEETKIVAKLIEIGGICLLCFENNPFVIEWHHIGGKTNSSVKLPLCANCHLLASKNQLTYGNLWCNPRKIDSLKLLYVLKDLHFLQNRVTEVIINELSTN